MNNYLILVIVLNLLVFIVALFVPMNLFIKGIILGGLFFILIIEYTILKIKKD